MRCEQTSAVTMIDIDVAVRETANDIAYLSTARKHLCTLFRIGNESVPIQLAQCWFPGLDISDA